MQKEKARQEKIVEQQKQQEKLLQPRTDDKKQGQQKQHNAAKARPQSQVLQHTPSGADKKPEDDAALTKAPKVHYVDTRGSSVNLEKYDERMETLVPQQASRMNNQQNKQKLVKQSQKRQQFGNKRRQEEQEKMRRLEQQAHQQQPKAQYRIIPYQ